MKALHISETSLDKVHSVCLLYILNFAFVRTHVQFNTLCWGIHVTKVAKGEGELELCTAPEKCCTVSHCACGEKRWWQHLAAFSWIKMHCCRMVRSKSRSKSN